MKYTIQEVLPAQIKVEFEDGSWALVPVSPDATKEQIDTAVSQYDPDFLPKPEDLINNNAIVGEIRTSVFSNNLEVQNNLNQPQNNGLNHSERTPFSDLHSSNLSIAEYYVLGEYFSKKGDDRLKNILIENVEKFVSRPEFSINELIGEITSDVDDIMRQAELELENGI